MTKIKTKKQTGAKNQVGLTELSVLYAPVTLKMSNLEGWINKRLPNNFLFHEERMLESGFLQLATQFDTAIKVRKYDTIKVGTEGKHLLVKVPLSVKLLVGHGLQIKPLEAEAVIIATAKIKLSITKNWKLGTKTDTVSYRWVSTPKFKILGLPFNFVNTLQSTITQLLPDIIGGLDDDLLKGITFREVIEQVWETLQSPFKISDEPPTTLLVSPADFQLKNIKIKDGFLKTTIGMRLGVQTFLGNAKDIDLPAAKPLPPLQKMEGEVGTSQLKLSNFLYFATLEKILTQSLESYAKNTKSIKISNVKMYSKDEWLVTELHAKGIAKGTIYFKAIPTYNPQTKKISLEKFDYLMRTNNILLRLADKVSHNRFTSQIHQGLETMLNVQAAEVLQTAHDTFSKTLQLKYLQLHTRLKICEITTLSLTAAAVKIDVLIAGDTSVALMEGMGK